MKKEIRCEENLCEEMTKPFYTLKILT